VEGRSAIQGLRSSGSDLVGALSRIQDELKVQPDIDFRVTVPGPPNFQIAQASGNRQRSTRPTQFEVYDAATFWVSEDDSIG
jgi:hypothetical protein